MFTLATVVSVVPMLATPSHRLSSSAAPELNVLMLFGFMAAFFTFACWIYQRQSKSMALAFATGLAAMAAYGFLVGDWPLGLIVSVLSVSAFWRWQNEKCARDEGTQRSLFRVNRYSDQWNLESRISHSRADWN